MFTLYSINLSTVYLLICLHFLDYFNLALSHSLDICVPSTLINRTYAKSPWFNTELIKLRQLFRRLQLKYASSKLEYDLIAFKVFDHFTIKTFHYKIVILHRYAR